MINELLHLTGLARSFFTPCQVSYLILYVTNRCNFRCPFCFYHAEIAKGRQTAELSLVELERLARTVGPLIQLSLTGGEPFLRQDLAEVTSLFIQHSAPKYITIPTNGSLTAPLVSYLENILPRFPSTYFRIPFSIDGIGSEHDLLRSAPGSYEKIIQSYHAITPLRRNHRNLVIDANCVFSSANQATILDTLRHLHRNFSFDNLSVTYARGNIKDPALKESSFRAYIAVNDFLLGLRRSTEPRLFYPVWRAVRDISREFLIRTVLKDECVRPCVAGRKLLVISETGEVYPCEILGRSMGNLRDTGFNLQELLQRSTNQQLLSWIRSSRCRCSFECALAANVLWGRWSLRQIFQAIRRNIGSPGQEVSTE